MGKSKTKMRRKNVSRKHGNKPTYQITGSVQHVKGVGGKGGWWNAAKGGRRVVYTDFSDGADKKDRPAVGAATAMVWGARVREGADHPQCARRSFTTSTHSQIGELEGI